MDKENRPFWELCWTALGVSAFGATMLWVAYQVDHALGTSKAPTFLLWLGDKVAAWI